MQSGEQISELLCSLGVDPAAANPNAVEIPQKVKSNGPDDQLGFGLVRTQSAQERLRRAAAEAEQRAAELEEMATRAELAAVQAELATMR